MTIKTIGVKSSEGVLAQAAFDCYNATRNLETAYTDYLQGNPKAQTTFKAFLNWASKNKWIARCNDIDDANDLALTRDTRRAGLENCWTAEQMSSELFQTLSEEIELKRSDMTHSDMARYLKIVVDINERWVDKSNASPAVVVNVNDAAKTIDVDDGVLRELGKKIVEDAAID